MENTRDKYKALLASLGVHLIIFFIAAAVGIFSMATMKEKSDNVEVVIYDEVQDEGSEGGGREILRLPGLCAGAGDPRPQG